MKATKNSTSGFCTARYETAMERLHSAYPGDVEAAVFYALALNEAADLSDLTYTEATQGRGDPRGATSRQPKASRNPPLYHSQL